MSGTSYPDPTSSQMDANNAGLYLSGRPDSRQSQHADQVQALLSASEQMEMPSLHELDTIQQHNLAQATPPQMVAQQAIDLDNHPANAYVTPSHDGISRDQRKRSKVSRACDECRRKKIRCDAAGAEEVSSCSSCRKSNRVCSYSRQPQKRGPSKGYIKELADRLKVIESRVQHDNNSLLDNFGSLRDFTSTLENSVNVGSKRTYSMMSSGSNGVQLYGFFEGDVTVHFNDRTPLYRRQLDLYYQHVQQLIPLFPPDKNELLARLSISPSPSIVAGLLSAIQCVNILLIPNVAMESPFEISDLMMRACEDLRDAQLRPPHVPLDTQENRSIPLSDMILLTAGTLLMAIVYDMRVTEDDTNTTFFGSSYASMSMWRNHDAIQRDGDNTAAFIDRICGLQFIVDRYSGVTGFGEFKLPSNSEDILTRYSLVVDEQSSQVARVAEVVGNIGLMADKPRLDWEHPVNFFVKGNLNRIRAAADRLHCSNQSLLRSAILHADLVIARHYSGHFHLDDLLGKTELLINSLAGFNHLTHHFAGLSAMSLVELVRESDINRDEINRVIDLFMDALLDGKIFHKDDGNGQAWINHLFSPLNTAKNFLSQADSVSGLQNLAEAAVTER